MMINEENFITYLKNKKIINNEIFTINSSSLLPSFEHDLYSSLSIILVKNITNFFPLIFYNIIFIE